MHEKYKSKALAAISRHRFFSILLITFVVLILSFGGYLLLDRVRPLGLADTRSPAPVVQILPPKPQLIEIAASFKAHQTVMDALVGHGLSNQEVYEMVERSRQVYNLARIKAGQFYWLYLTQEGKFKYFNYIVDDEKFLTIYRDQENRFVPVMKPFRYETRIEPVAGTIEESLFMSMLDAGEQERLALALADIFGSDIDFYTDIRKGDSYRLLVEKKYLNGGFWNYGSILAASITNQNKRFSGFRFQDENGKPAYYSPEGKALRKSFLKSPLKFARITSKFSRARMHPILKIVRPHLGVDYAAPVGTPVQAVGAGVVILTGQTAGSGKLVRLRHSGNLETMYMHLSRIAVRLGAHVAQGTVIGYVGATGMATGPHLDFRVWQHGKPINPAKVIIPPGPPVPASSFPRFALLRDDLMSRLAQITN